MLNRPSEFGSTNLKELADIADEMLYEISYPLRRQFVLLPKLGKQMQAGKVQQYKGSLNFGQEINAGSHSRALDFKFVNTQATMSEVNVKPLSSVKLTDTFEPERLNYGAKNAYNKVEIARWYHIKFNQQLDQKLTREKMVAEFKAKLKER